MTHSSRPDTPSSAPKNTLVPATVMSDGAEEAVPFAISTILVFLLLGKEKP
jgi:hypothetical protein